jgi:ABC-type phosphate/phosphonate transport system substrate-binding protein
MNWVAALPMYNVTPTLADDWRALLEHVRVKLRPWLVARGDTLELIDPDTSLTAFWLRADVLLTQTCGYPLMHALDGRVQLVYTPIFSIDGCANGDYRSVLVARKAAGVTSLEGGQGLRAAYNSNDSNSGMNLLRHAVAPLANGRAFFASAIETGGHLASLKALADDRADIAAIDCVTFAFVRDHLPALADSVIEIGVTASSPGLPLIASKNVPADGIDALRMALSSVIGQDPPLAKRLKLAGFAERPIGDYSAIIDLETDAARLGYSRLA